MKVLIATSNRGKREEFSRILKDSPIEPLFPEEPLEVEESGKSYLENALIKAKAYHKAYGIPTLADDSGLEVDALEGYPGIFSSRFWSIEYGGIEEGPDPPDVRNIRKVLRLLEGKPRTAKFRAVIVLCTDNGYLFSEGECRGHIANEPRGDKGFGYDPIFIPDGYRRTIAEISPEEKDSISHRGKAVRNLLNLLTDIQLYSFPSPLQGT